MKKLMIVSLVAMITKIGMAEAPKEKMIRLESEVASATSAVERLDKLMALSEMTGRQLHLWNKHMDVGKQIVPVGLQVLDNTTNLFDRIKVRNKIEAGYKAQFFNKPTDDSRAWNEGTQSELVAYLHAIEYLPDDEFLAKSHCYETVETLATAEKNKTELLRYANRLYAMDSRKKSVRACQFWVFEMVVNGIRRSPVREERCKAVKFYHWAADVKRNIEGDRDKWAKYKLNEADALFRVNYDLAGARAAVKSVLDDSIVCGSQRENAFEFREMLKD